MREVRFYKVGGCVRDELLGRMCKDIDYSVEAESFQKMREEILDRGGKIFVENPEYLTIRANIPLVGACDFVLCRKDGVYYDGRHPETVEPGTIYDDLARRDFTMNAIAKQGYDKYLDPHNGINDIKHKLIRCVGDPRDRFAEDSLRLLRAIRFAIVLNFQMHASILRCFNDKIVVDGLQCVSIERIREELVKAFRADTMQTLQYLERFHMLRDVIFENDELRLMPTLQVRF